MKARALLTTSAAIALAAACTPSNFDPSTKLQSVRVLGTRADGDAAYAKPGDHVTLQTLAVDARRDKPRPMTVYWVPFVCQDPKGDSYAACFTQGQGSGSGSSGPGSALLQPGSDVTALLPTGTTYAFDVPAGIKINHVEGAPNDYGLVIVFNVVCAGRVQIKSFDPATGPQQVPIGCFDESGRELSPNDYVIGFTRVYVYSADAFASDPRMVNHNPDIAGVVVNGKETPTTSPVDRLPAPVDVDLPACRGGCEPATIDLDAPDSSWEENPNDKDEGGNVRHEAIWVDYYATGGSIEGDARLLYDATLHRMPATEVKYSPPDDPGEATLYAVVHDDRDGMTWLQVNVHAH